MRIVQRLSLLILLVYFLPGCLGTKYLEEDQKLLYKQQIKAPKGIDKEELTELYVQRPNRQFPIIPFSPYVWFYYHGRKRYNKIDYTEKKEHIREKWNGKINALQGKPKKAIRYQRKRDKKLAKVDKTIEEGNVWMRWGEPISTYSPANTKANIDRFELYLSSKGYFLARVDSALKTTTKRVSVTYTVSPRQAYTIDTSFVQVQDTAIHQLLIESQAASTLKKGDNYDQDKLSKERERIDLLLKDNGYFDFSRQYIEFDVDTSFNGSQKVAIRTRISEPLSRGYHKVFTVDSVNFTTDANLNLLPDSLRRQEYYEGINYRYFNKEYNKKILSRRVFIEKDGLYSRSNTFSTQRQLANLDIFRFININYDSTGAKLVANVFTSPLNRYQWSNEVGVNVTQGFPGPFYNVSFKKRNVFQGMEIFEMNGRVGIEGVAPATDIDDVYASTEIGVNASLTFPQFLFPISAAAKDRLGRINPKTRLLAGFNYTRRPEYIRENFNFSNTYTWQNRNNTQYQFSLTDVSIINSAITEQRFQDRLDTLEQNGNRLINSFLPSFVSSMIFSATWNFNSYGLNFSNSSFFRLFLESGGTTLNLVNTDFLARESLEFYKYLKINADFRKTNPINQNTTLAYRINAGIAKPYSENRVLPYEKYFFAGGSNGIRAWRPRRLGPGSYTPLDSTENGVLVNYDFEQQGEILLEGSVELRKNLIGFIDYAIFMDFGNIWMIREDGSRPGAQFKLDRFFREIAVGGGMGLRFDFSFLVLRLDAGLKLYDPARPRSRRFILSPGFYDAPFTAEASEPIVLNIGIGYPF